MQPPDTLPMFSRYTHCSPRALLKSLLYLAFSVGICCSKNVGQASSVLLQGQHASTAWDITL
jgi:hypothetical protein